MLAARLLCMLTLLAIGPTSPPLVNAECAGSRTRGGGSALNPDAAAAVIELTDLGGHEAIEQLTGDGLEASQGEGKKQIVGILHGVYAGDVPLQNISGTVLMVGHDVNVTSFEFRMIGLQFFICFLSVFCLHVLDAAFVCNMNY